MRLLAALVAPLFAMAACGGNQTPVAHDPGASSPPAATTSSGATADPTTGTYPHYEPTDYGFDLVVSCFCADANTPVRVTVLHAKVVGAVYLGDAPGRGTVRAGDTADQHDWLTINDVIDQANNTSAAKVTVEWPRSQDYPSSVHVDLSSQAADDDVIYQISNVQPSS